eukprot:751237-Hanusia_phi.AAC.1
MGRARGRLVWKKVWTRARTRGRKKLLATRAGKLVILRGQFRLEQKEIKTGQSGIAKRQDVIIAERLDTLQR